MTTYIFPIECIYRGRDTPIFNKTNQNKWGSEWSLETGSVKILVRKDQKTELNNTKYQVLKCANFARNAFLMKHTSEDTLKNQHVRNSI